ncbi:MAG TPA: hypothetical protein VNH18_22975 [Bryobacteraceae bacterium]|nr:hypothetical protein [Bryobacteraceae bacterium]
MPRLFSIGATRTDAREVMGEADGTLLWPTPNQAQRELELRRPPARHRHVEKFLAVGGRAAGGPVAVCAGGFD